jgi:hypothetical protein
MQNRKPARVAIYAHVSTDDRGQNPEREQQLRDWCKHAGHEIVRRPSVADVHLPRLPADRRN